MQSFKDDTIPERWSKNTYDTTSISGGRQQRQQHQQQQEQQQKHQRQRQHHNHQHQHDQMKKTPREKRHAYPIISSETIINPQTESFIRLQRMLRKFIPDDNADYKDFQSTHSTRIFENWDGDRQKRLLRSSKW